MVFSGKGILIPTAPSVVNWMASLYIIAKRIESRLPWLNERDLLYTYGGEEDEALGDRKYARANMVQFIR